MREPTWKSSTGISGISYFPSNDSKRKVMLGIILPRRFKTFQNVKERRIVLSTKVPYFVIVGVVLFVVATASESASKLPRSGRKTIPTYLPLASALPEGQIPRSLYFDSTEQTKNCPLASFWLL